MPCRGSSPLARGLRGGVDGVHLWFRIIPARAGFTRPPPWGGRADRDHSRSRGVYLRGRPDGRGRPGSSPLARGLHFGRVGRRPGRRIIPARAGFTGWATPPPWAPWDHPRSRGVYHQERRDLAQRRGSSPLARGLLNPDPTSGLSSRIIPARAGFTPVRTAGSIVAGDHPRSRGVYSRRPAPVTLRAGSSPLARGLPSSSFTTVSTGGIIPARAGFTGWVAGRWAPPRDHPRSRGVYDDLVDVRTMTVGSSPLARGLRRIRLTALMGLRIIPARAGFTLLFCVTGCWGPGSSPLARGLPDPEALSSGVTRIIPARAGFTAITDAFKGFLEDHPRSRGVYRLPPIRSSPGSWIIPARAGFTRWRAGRCR